MDKIRDLVRSKSILVSFLRCVLGASSQVTDLPDLPALLTPGIAGIIGPAGRNHVKFIR